jgi:hypothetical protein
MKAAGILCPSARRRGAITLLIALCLPSLSCSKKVAPMAMPKARYYAQSSVSSGGGGGYAPATVSTALASVEQSSVSIPERKIIRNGSLSLLVNNVAQSTEKITSIATAAGGFVEKATQTNSGGHTASITLRVPAQRLDQIMADVKRLASNVENESVEVRDVTREYIDVDAHLRNAKAEEAQYLLILKRATTIKDTLDVTEKLSDVRGRIEQLQGEMNYLSSQIDMSSLEISLRAEADADVAGIHWRPLRQAKIAFSEMLSGLADWADSVIAFFVNLPLIAVWLLSIVVPLVVAVRIVIFLWKRLGPKMNWRWSWRRASSPEQSAR